MGREPVAPDWPELNAEELGQVLARYPGAGKLKSLLWHSPRPFSAASLVETTNGALFVKRYPLGMRDPDSLAGEHRFIEHLAARGVPVSSPLRTGDGDSAFAIGRWCYEVQGRAEGEDLYREALSWTPFLGTAHAFSAGRTLAALHLAASGYRAPSRRTTVLVANFRLFGSPDPLSAIGRDLVRRPLLAGYLAGHDWRSAIEEDLMPFHAALCPHLAGQPPLWTHGDWHASNLLWEGERVRSVLDFGLADRSFALFDLATAIERNLIEWLDLDEGRDPAVHEDQLDALLAGYASLRPFPTEALAALLPLVHADFALSEVEYFHGIVRSPANADLAYLGYLLGHARWFASGRGEALLTRIRNWKQK